MRVRMLAAVIVGIVALGLPGVAAGDPSTVVVDDDAQQCPGAVASSIQDGVNLVQAGGTVKVCPGTYTEQVELDKPGVRIDGPGSPIDCFTEAAPDPARDAIVQGGPTPLPPSSTSPPIAPVGFDIRADGVVVEGLVLRHYARAVEGVAAGRANVSGYAVRHNLVQDNIWGVTFDSDGRRLSRATGNCFRRNGSGRFGGAVVSLGFDLANGHIQANRFRDTVWGIRLGGAVDVTVQGNVSVGDAVWLRPGLTENLRVVDNHVQGGTGSGIWFFLNPSFPQGRNVGAHLAGNVIERRGESGISADNGSLVGAHISGNVLNDNRLDGVRIGAGNHDNTVVGNTMLRNTEHDCHDETTGSGTAGTANVWSGNRALTENRVGLCTNGA